MYKLEIIFKDYYLNIIILCYTTFYLLKQLNTIKKF